VTALAQAIGFGFHEVQARPKPVTGQPVWLAWPGFLAWLGLAFGLRPSHAHYYPHTLRRRLPRLTTPKAVAHPRLTSSKQSESHTATDKSFAVCPVLVVCVCLSVWECSDRFVEYL